jgi:Flp pilus assembly protein TadD
VWYELAVAEGIADDARALMQRSVRERPELLAGWSSYVAALLAIGETDEAARVAERACARFPHAPRAFVDASVAAAARGDGVAERAHLEHALTLEPTNLEAVRQMVVLLVAADELDAARAVAERASRLGGQEHARLFAQVLRRRGELALALTTLERALRVDPFELDLWHDFHLTSKEAGAVEGALPAARALSATGPREPRRVLPQVSLALSESRPEEALAALEPLAVEAPFRIPVQRARAEVHLRLGDTGAALAALSPVEGAPDSPALALDEAHIQLSKGDWDAANTAVERAHRLAPNDFDVLHRRLEIASAVGDEALACSVGRRLVALFPSNPNAHSLLGSTLLGAGQPDAARAAFATAVRLDPMHPANRPLFTLERIQVHEGAPATLARLAAVLPPGELRVSAFRLALARRDDVRLRELVDELCVEADLVLDRITDLGRLCALAGRHKLFYRRIAEHLDDPSARGVVGEWLAAAAARRNARLPNPFDLAADLPAAQGVARVQLVRLATSDAKWPFTTTVFRFRRWLRADPASVAVVFEGFRRLRRNWTLLLFARGIGELSPAARFHLGFALRELGLAKRAERLHRAGIDDPPEYATCHRIALAFAVAGRGDPVQVSRMLAPIEERFVPSWLTTLLEMARALHKVELDGLDLRTCVPQLLATAGPYQQYMARKLLDCGAGASLLPTAHPWACFGVVAAAALVVFAQAIGERRYLWWAAAIVAFIVGQAILRRVKEVA